jgi:hypothetical protein
MLYFFKFIKKLIEIQKIPFLGANLSSVVTGRTQLHPEAIGPSFQAVPGGHLSISLKL